MNNTNTFMKILQQKIIMFLKRWTFPFLNFLFIVFLYFLYQKELLTLSNLYLAVILVFEIWILYLCKSRNAWDVFYYNFAIAPIMLFMIGIISNNISVWKDIIWGSVFIFTAGGAGAMLIKRMFKNQ